MSSFIRFFLASGFSVLALVVLSTVPASAKQCVWNKSGFLVNVKWYEPAEFRRHQANPAYKPRPAQVDQFPLFSGRCTRGRNANRQLIAVVSAVGRSAMMKATRFTIQGVVGFTAVVACAGTVGTGCAAAALGGPAAAAILSGAIPDAGDVFWVGVPSSRRYLDVWGTVWEPVAKNVGGPIR